MEENESIESVAATNEETFNDSFAEVGANQNLVLGIICSLLTAIVCALIWAAITVASGYQIGYMAIGLGFLVGKVNHFTGRGNTIVFGVVGAVMALLGCVLGNYMTIIGFTAGELNMGYIEAFNSFSFSTVFEAMKENFSVIDILFYGIAGYEGFKFSLMH